MKKVILFDMDGTLIDSSEGILKCAEYALNHYGMEPKDEATMRKFIGPPLWESFVKIYGFDKETALEAVEIYRERYNTKGLFEISAYPGVEECLKELKEEGCKIGVASSKPEITCGRILEHLGILSYFDEVIGATFDGIRETKIQVLEEAFRRFGDCEKSEICLIGDTIFDVNGANEGGIDCAAVSFGFGNIEAMTKAGAAFVCDDMTELPGMIREYWG